MMYVLNKLPEMKQPSKPSLFTPDQPCGHKCSECEANSKRGYEECNVQKQALRIAKDGNGWRTKYHFLLLYESGKSRIHNNMKTCAKVVGFDATSLYSYCSGQEMPCGKEQYVEVDQPNDTEELCNQIMSGELF